MVKKKLPDSLESRRAMMEPGHPELSLRRQCELIGLTRSTYYYEPAGESELNLRLMRLIDEQYLKTPFYGWPKMSAMLRRQGYPVNHKRVQRLMHLMGLHAIYPKPKTTLASPGHKKYPVQCCDAILRTACKDHQEYGNPRADSLYWRYRSQSVARGRVAHGAIARAISAPTCVTGYTKNWKNLLPPSGNGDLCTNSQKDCG